MRAVFAANMAYRPRSAPNFPGDLQHDVRDALLDCRAQTLSDWMGLIAQKYLVAARMLDLRDDPIADSLETFVDFDMRTLQVAHDHMAAHWRHRWMPVFLDEKPGSDEGWTAMLPDPDRWVIRGSLTGVIAGFRWWLHRMVDYDALHDPVMIRLFCLVLVQQNTTRGIMAEIDLFDALRQRYPLPAMPPSSDGRDRLYARP